MMYTLKIIKGKVGSAPKIYAFKDEEAVEKARRIYKERVISVGYHDSTGTFIEVWKRPS